MDRIRLSVLNGVLFSVLTCTAVFAQTTAQINGTVRDQSGAVLPSTEIKATQTATGAVRTATSDETGAYVIPNLPIGPYMLEVSLPGFRTYVQTGIVLQVGSNPVFNAVLEVGQITDTVEVQANAALVETRSTGVGTVIDNQRVLELPLNGRNVMELIFLAGIANTSNVGFLTSVRNYPTVQISVAGGITNWIHYNFDGTTHNDSYNNLNLPLPFPDALQEFKVESSAVPAQYGVHASATVNVVTKSGTNEFHGSAFEFVRNGIFNARNFFAPKRDTLKRNQFGGVIGGPIVRSKLFFFGGYQGTIQRSEPSQNIAYVPTPAMLAGDFSTFAAPPCQPRQITLAPAQGFVNNRISPALFNPAALKIMARLPATADPCGMVTYPLTANSSEHMFVSRIDWQKSDKHSMFGRFYVTNLEVPSTYDGKNALTLTRNRQHDRVYALAIGDTYLLGSGVVSAFRIGANRSYIPKVVDDFGPWTDFGVNAPYNPAPSPSLSVSGGNGFSIGSGSSIINTDAGGPNPSISEDISWIRGTHQIGFGGTYFYSILNYISGVTSAGSMQFDGTTSGLGLADFLLGKASQWSQGNVQSYLYSRRHYYGAYAQDSWKATPRLTVNYGLRWEPYIPYTNKHGWLMHFDQELFNQGVRSTMYPNGPAGLIFPGDPQWTPGGNKIAHTRWLTFLPRLGLVWDPKGDGSMSIRASAGMFTDQAALYSGSGMAQGFGSVILQRNVNMHEPWANYPGGNPLPIVFDRNYKFSTNSAYITANLHWKPTTVNQFALSIQKQLGTDWLLAANYIGNTTTHMAIAGQLNPAVFLGTGPCTLNTGTGPVSYPICSTTANTNQRRVLSLQNPAQGQYYANLSMTDDGGTMSYNGLYMTAQKRLSRGTTMLANYTWSHCIGDVFNTNPGNNGASAVTPGNRRADRSNCNTSDQRHVFNLSGVLQTPRFSNRALQVIASDWQISPIVKIKSGQFFTVSLGVDNARNGEGGGNQRPNQVPGISPYAANKSVDGWLNRDAFATPPVGSLGDIGMNTLVGPGQVQLDVSLSRTFTLAEGKTLQFRSEAFNLPNHLNPANPVSALNQGTFGRIQSDISGTSGLSPGNQRIIQFALKFVF